MMRITDVVKNLLIINVIAFFGLRYALKTFDVEKYVYLYPINGGFNPYQLFTHMFMHGDERHLIFNMIGLFFIGQLIENTLGPRRFLMLYISAGLVGGIVHLLTTGGIAVGASGALNGIMAALAFMYPNLKLMVFPFPFEIKAKYLVGAFILIDFFMGVTSYSSNIAHFAHLGGAITGFFMIWKWNLHNLR